jgi:hypothetical protein
MSQRERQALAEATAVVAVAPPKNSTSAVAAPRFATSPEPLAPIVSQWELLYRSASPAQQADLLALASQQGLLYNHQLPPVPTSPRALAPADEPRTWNLLGRILAGQVGQLDPVRPPLPSVVDDALDEAQRHAVAVALATPDICLVQGLPGTGKSRVVAEIVTQAALRGDRVLFLAAHPAALDRVLEQVADRDCLCPIRCLGPEEHAAHLPASVRALTLEQRVASVRHNTLRSAREARQAAELQCARRRHEEPLWSQLRDLAQKLTERREGMARAEAQHAAVEAEVNREIASAAPHSRVAADIKVLEAADEERRVASARDAAAFEGEREQQRAKLAEADQQIAVVQPLAAAKEQGRWWSPTWWKATLKGDVVGRLAQLQAQRQQLQSAVTTLDARLKEVAETEQSGTTQTQAARRARIQAEIERRQKKLQDEIDKHQHEVQRHETLWDDLCRQIDPEALRPAAPSAQAVEAAQEQWLRHRQDDGACLAFAREWAEFLETSSEVLAARLPGCANLVAATPGALAADPHFGDAAASGGQFDLLVLEEADHWNESDFLKAARRARHWVLVGEPPWEADLRASAGRSRSAPGRSVGATSRRGQCFHKLWEHLHCNPSLLPYAWFREGQRLGCRFRQLAPEQRQWLESEPLADAPDVELRILALPRVRPVLAEVLFPGTMAVPAAKEFLFRELQEITVQTSGCCLRWCETAESIELHFGLAATPPTYAVGLDNGVRELLSGDGKTFQLAFDRAAGFDRAAVELWLDQHLHLRDLGRTAWLDVPHRMAAPLAGVLSDLLFGGGYRSVPETCRAEPSEPAVEFLAVAAKNRGPARSTDGRNSRRPEHAGGHLSSTGSGLEIDLSAPRQSERLPHDLRAVLPNRGFVNLLEAKAVVRKLEDLRRQGPAAKGRSAPALAVVALYPAQAELIRHLLQHSPQMAAHAGTIPIGPPGAFRHREADIVLVSLTRSHSHRAVAYGEGPAALVQAWTRARQRLMLFGDPGNLVRRSQWQGVLDHLDEMAASHEGQVLGRLVHFLQADGRHSLAFRWCEGNMA